MSVKQYTTVIFDLDGTLTYTLEDLWLSTNYALRQFHLPERTLEEVRCFVGNGVETLMRRAVGHALAEAHFQRCFSTFKDYYVLHCQDHTRLYDGIAALLAELKARGYRIAIVSNKLQAGVDELYERYFRGCVDVALGEQPGIRRKPAPDMVEKVLRLLNVRPDEALYVGDSEVDIQTARNSRLPCVSVLWGFREKKQLLAAGATCFIQRPEELINILEN